MFCIIPFLLQPFGNQSLDERNLHFVSLFSSEIKKGFLLSCVPLKKEIDTEYKNNIN
ncbi:hypothetical protein I33_0817 [Bacillus subtilis subsp. subtilis str. RO-NN-1]|nr:hypothetical protein I33_0817 [Bacillus subtilis subsp. subtilis str. RO-NN-1]